MRQSHYFTCSLVLFVIMGLMISAPDLPAQDDRAQTRTAMERVAVNPDSIDVDDGDTVTIRWGGDDVEIIRILGIDTPETQHIGHNLPFDQPFGREAAGFAMGAFALATKVELLRADQMDPYGRTLGYLFLNGKNYSALIVAARLASETVNHYGDNGFPKEAAEVLAAAKTAGPVPFEPPFQFRQRMREVTDWMRATGQLPEDE
ncbi:MAG: thermonuclease family protein [Candidatus Eisenbacteria bacterium]|uniref:Thermonuclease family protein n=1 Tax=Eiseniibacteriota bacterium TaxID=2212470 RepID=A0A948RV50_UNCEI|nr:thermonuclease family protein [Candidatus Eisenbacteria bacterium]MBU2691578.1 thermonuclease family protein [Candidatus Eisenbacteria bacterium]